MRLKLLFALNIIFICFLFSCKTTEVNKIDPIPVDIPEETSDSVMEPLPDGSVITETILETPDKKDIEDRLLDEKLIRNIEIASPGSLRLAVQHIQSDTKGLTDTNRLYLVLSSEVMKRIYPHEKIDWVVPSYKDHNKYLDALKTIDLGEYPLELETNTFFELMIPSFILLNDGDNSRYFSDIKSRLAMATDKYPSSVLPYLMQGILQLKLGYTTEARRLFKKAWQMDKTCTTAGIKYAFLLAKAGDGDEALKISKELQKSMGKTVEYKLLLAEANMVLKNYEVANPYIVQVLSEDPENTVALLFRIRVLIAQEEYLKASSLLDAFATTGKRDKDYLLLSSKMMLLWSKNKASAANILSQAYELYPNDFDVLLACAEICFETGFPIKGNYAGDFIEKVLQRDAENIQATVLIVKNDIGNQNWGSAIMRAERLISAYPSAENLGLLVMAYLGAGRASEALGVATKLYKKTDEPSDEVLSLYLLALQRNSKYYEMTRVVNQYMPTANQARKSILYYYQAQLSSGENKLSLLRSSLLSDPRNKNALFAMYDWYNARGNYKKARYYLQQVIAIDPLNKKNINLLKQLENKL
ncbi:MAG: hypothetical protein CR988_06150 [Treponema sp.]|nr:MAG: hypothetical protein CR988_06150 [Treponema sp.]